MDTDKSEHVLPQTDGRLDGSGNIKSYVTDQYREGYRFLPG